MLRFYSVLLCSLLFACSSCNRNPYNYQTYGADEFVQDSYRILAGKASILQMEGREVGELTDADLEEFEDAIAEDDILEVMLYHPKRKDMSSSLSSLSDTIGFRVTNGKILLPDIGTIEIAGLTMRAAQEKIQARYNEEIKDSEIFLKYKDRLARKIDLTGHTSLSNYPVNGKIRLYEVLSIARIHGQANLHMSYVLRDGKVLPIDFYKLLVKGDMSQNIVMRGGDKVHIADPNESRAMIMGEVGVSRPISLPHGFMSIREALVAAHGIPFSGDKRYIQVIRGNLAQPKLYTLDWNVIVHLRNESLLLMPGDTVYVSPKPITEWNRFISQIPPGMSGLNSVITNSKALGLQ